MSPFIKAGSVLTVKKVEKILVGDVVVYRRKGEFIAHRVIKKTHDGGEVFLVTKGDNLFYKDEPIEEDQILGKVVRVEKQGKTISMNCFSSNILNRLLALLSPCVLPHMLAKLRKIKSLVVKDRL